MAQTNFNKFVRITFNKPINTLNMSANVRAFSLSIQQRDCYGGTLYEKLILPISVERAAGSTSAIILKFSDEDNFRKAEGPVLLNYSAIYGNFYGTLQTDRVVSFSQTFNVHDTDGYQNPREAETVHITNANTTSCTITHITVHDCHVTETIRLLNLCATVPTITQINEIQP